MSEQDMQSLSENELDSQRSSARAAPAMINTARLTMRSWLAEDAEQLLPILEHNQDHFASWIPAHVSATAALPELEERLRRFATNFSAAREWRYAIFERDAEGNVSRLLGELDLFPRAAAGRVHWDDADHLEIGYWLRRDATGNGIVTEAARAAVDIARSLPRVRRVEIRCDARNRPSARVPERLGFELRDEGGAESLQVWELQFAECGSER